MIYVGAGGAVDTQAWVAWNVQMAVLIEGDPVLSAELLDWARDRPGVLAHSSVVAPQATTVK